MYNYIVYIFVIAMSVTPRRAVQSDRRTHNNRVTIAIIKTTLRLINLDPRIVLSSRLQ